VWEISPRALYSEGDLLLKKEPPPPQETPPFFPPSGVEDTLLDETLSLLVNRGKPLVLRFFTGFRAEKGFFRGSALFPFVATDPFFLPQPRRRPSLSFRAGKTFSFFFIPSAVQVFD